MNEVTPEAVEDWMGSSADEWDYSCIIADLVNGKATPQEIRIAILTREDKT